MACIVIEITVCWARYEHFWNVKVYETFGRSFSHAERI